MLAFWILATALAGDFALAESAGPRRLKVEAYAIRGEGDFAASKPEKDVFQVWSGLLSCTREEPRMDRCTFDGGKARFAFKKYRDEDLSGFDVRTPELELRWNAKGRLRAELVGDKDGFAEDSAEIAKAMFLDKPESAELSQDLVRQLAQVLEENFVHWVAGALEFQTPKDRSGEKGWKAEAPMVARSWEGSAFGGSVQMKLDGTEGERLTVSGEGRFGEVAASGSMVDQTTKGTVVVQGVFDLGRGVPVSSRTEVTFSDFQTGDFAKRLVLMREALEGDTAEAGQIAGSPLRRE